MKKQITILIFVILHLSLFAQHGKVIKITTACNDKFVNEYAGIWLPQEYYLTNAGLNKSQQQEWTTRFEAFFKLVKEAYPNPVGSDGFWNCHANKISFGGHEQYSIGSEVKPIKINPAIAFDFDLGLWFYYCKGANEISTGFPDGEWSYCGMQIDANSLDNFVLDKAYSGINYDDGWRINGRPIKMKLPVVGTWKGYDLCKQYGGQLKNQTAVHHVLLTRPGMLPYIPVTRKQYFDIAIPIIKKFYEDQLADLSNIPLRSIEEQEAIKNKKIDEIKKKYPGNPGMLQQYLTTYTTDQQELERKKNTILKSRNDDLRKFQNELDKDTREGTLESTAIVASILEMMTERPVFTTEEQGGYMLVTENPNYLRKDLPASAAQFFVMTWWWGDGAPWRLRFKNAIEENFPVEKLQAMIDK